MDLLEAIFTRQSISKVRPDPVPRAVIEQLLLAAVQAPNHYKVRPWRFVVLSGPARERLGEVLADSIHQRMPELDPAALDKERGKPLRAPLLIAVGVDRPEDARVVEMENICAVAAAVQNLLLAAHAAGLGCIWRTGPAAYDPLVKQFLGFDPGQHLLGFLYLGYPEILRPLQERPGFADRTTWLDA